MTVSVGVCCCNGMCNTVLSFFWMSGDSEGASLSVQFQVGMKAEHVRCGLWVCTHSCVSPMWVAVSVSECVYVCVRERGKDMSC